MFYNLKITAVTPRGTFEGTAVIEPSECVEDYKRARDAIQEQELRYIVLNSVSAAGVPTEIRLGGELLKESVLTFEIIEIEQNV